MAALGALLVLSGCEMWAAKTADETGEAVQQFTKDGRPLINLSIGYGSGTAGQSRALFEDLAKSFNFIEVIFKDSGDNYYAKSVRRPNTLKIAIPAGDYDGGTGNGDAIMLVGLYNNGAPILLATGKINPSDTDISAADTQITFILHSLTFDDLNDTNQVDFAASTESVELREINAGSYAGLKYFNVSTGTGGTISMDVTISGDASTEHLVEVSPAVLHIQPWNLPDLSIIGLNPLTGPTIASDFSTAGAIVFTVTAGYAEGATGLAAVSFDVPVKGFEDGSDNPNAVTWHIQTGLSNADLDAGGESPGGAILLELGTTGLTTYSVDSGGL